MIDDYLTLKEYRLSDDAREFLHGIGMILLNMLRRERVNTRDVELLGTNDIEVLRGTNIVVIAFSRSTAAIRPCFAERALSLVLPDEDQVSFDEPTGFNEPAMSVFLDARKFVDPICVAFPISYLSRQAEELEEAHTKVASVLVEPAKEDVDRKRRIVRANPIFHGRDFTIERDLCFVLMEFNAPYTEIYDSLIRPTVEGEGFRCLKSDDIFATTSVIEDIWANINKASLIIAEISSNNPNVMYELGVCHTVGKNVMMLTQDPDAIPFNFRHMRAYPYVNDIPGSDDLKKNIASVIQHVKATAP